MLFQISPPRPVKSLDRTVRPLRREGLELVVIALRDGPAQHRASHHRGQDLGGIRIVVVRGLARTVPRLPRPGHPRRVVRSERWPAKHQVF